MKLIVSIAVFLFSVSVWAKPVSGEVFYKKKSGEIARRAVVLEVPAKGQGSVTLSGNGFKWITKDFWSAQDGKQTTFTVVFPSDFMVRKSMIALDGTYMQGTNEIIYNGNMYKKDGHAPVNGDISDFTFLGGFTFTYDRT